ncbi:interferon-related developmental regulator-domain-containing protein [Amylocarpus encephaloides]|uniref:Interferon-related developmental regulator-domain-containing protein n=1 Tax=Amylocarpus encephaloides TaxID=45428 RepID=A0A9P7YBJ6_9HELO|nr:interferon-related developmental regulator-domain-containing protein [Amylocarpus encephaloides]
MHDLRRQALESKKTVSRKAQSRVSSRASSATNSRTHSRNPSRQASDDEDGNMSDSTNWSVNSIGDMLALELPEDTAEGWKESVGNLIEKIVDRKRSSVQEREENLEAYDHYFMGRYSIEALEGRTTELFPAFLKSVKTESSEKETCFALRAIAITLITIPSETAYDGLFQALKTAYTSSEFSSVKASAIHALGVAAMYGGAGDTGLEEIMDDLLEIIESDGTSIEAEDSAEVVIAACQEWGFLATSLEDIEARTESAMDAFVEQLESSDTSVQVAAGENIALLYEKSWTDREEADGPPCKDRNENAVAAIEAKYVKRYEVYRHKNQLEHTLTQLANESSRRVSKKDRKTLHSSFSDILNTVNHPALGPRFSMAMDEDGFILGSRMKLHTFAGVKMIDRWWKLLVLQALKRVLGPGFLNHYRNNEVVYESLPLDGDN